MIIPDLPTNPQQAVDLAYAAFESHFGRFLTHADIVGVIDASLVLGVSTALTVWMYSPSGRAASDADSDLHVNPVVSRRTTRVTHWTFYDSALSKTSLKLRRLWRQRHAWFRDRRQRTV